MDDYELELGRTPSVEDTVMEEEDMKETLNTFVELVHTLIEKSAKLRRSGMLFCLCILGLRARNSMAE